MLQDRYKLFGILAVALWIGGCDEPQGPIESAGEEVDEAVEDAGDSLDGAGPVEEAGEDVDQALENAGESLEEAGDAVERKTDH